MSQTTALAATIEANQIRKDVFTDKYGRRVTEYTLTHRAEGHREDHRAVVCNLPKVWSEKYGTKFLVNDRARRGEDSVSYYANRITAHATAVQFVLDSASKAGVAIK